MNTEFFIFSVVLKNKCDSGKKKVLLFFFLLTTSRNGKGGKKRIWLDHLRWYSFIKAMFYVLFNHSPLLSELSIKSDNNSNDTLFLITASNKVIYQEWCLLPSVRVSWGYGNTSFLKTHLHRSAVYTLLMFLSLSQQVAGSFLLLSVPILHPEVSQKPILCRSLLSWYAFL